MQTTFGPLQFLPVNLNEQRSICIKFVVDAFVASFGSSEKFYQHNGPSGELYLDWLKSKIHDDPPTVVHIWESGDLVGQMELGRFKPEPSTGFVSLYYLIPEKRGRSYSKYLEQYAEHFLKERGFSKAKLSVSPTNERAIRFYTRMGWKDLGPRPDYPSLNFMEKNFS